jgi:ribA/ribD-fused uncharacterized protein
MQKIHPFLTNFMSNFYLSRFYSDKYGVWFPTTEHYFMYVKALTFNDTEIASKVLKAVTPQDAKGLGRRVKNFDPTIWTNISYQVMLDANLLKYTQNPSLRIKLLETNDDHLVEGNPDDAIWGVALHWKDSKILNPDNWKGKNLLGKVLMEVRQTLREQFVKKA